MSEIIKFGDEAKDVNKILDEQLKLFKDIAVVVKKAYAPLPSELTKQLRDQNTLEIQAEKLRQESIKSLERLEELSKKQIQTAKEAQRLQAQNRRESQALAKEQERIAKQKERENQITERQNKLLKEQQRPYNQLKLARQEASKALQDLLSKENANTQAVIKARMEYNKLDKQFRTINESMRNYQDNVGNYASFLSGSIGKLISAFGIAGGLTTGVAILKDAINSVIEFNNGMLNVMKTTGLSRAETDKLGQSVRRLSSELKVVSSVQLTEYMAVAGQLGIKGTSNLLKFTEAMAKLEVASNIAGEEGASNMAKFLNLIEGGVQNVKLFGDEIVNMGNNFPTTEKQILDTATSVAQGTAIYNFGRQSALAYATALASLGVESELAGSKIAKTLKEMEKAIISGGKELEGFARISGVTTEEFTKLFDADKEAALTKFISGLNKVKTSGGSVIQTLTDLGLKEERLDRVLSTLASEGGFKQLSDALVMVKDSTGAMSEEFDTASTKLISQINSLKVSWENLILAFEDGSGTASKAFAVIASMLNNTINMVERAALSWDELYDRAESKGADYGVVQAEKLISSLQNDADKRLKINTALTKLTVDQLKLEKEIADLRATGLNYDYLRKQLEEKQGMLGLTRALSARLRQEVPTEESMYYSANINEYGVKPVASKTTTKGAELSSSEKSAIKRAEEERLKAIAEYQKIEVSMRIETERNRALAVAKSNDEIHAINLKYNEDSKEILKLNYDEEVRLAKGVKEKLVLAEKKYQAEIQKIDDDSFKITEEAREEQYKNAVKLANMLEDNDAKNAMKSQLLVAKSEQDKLQARLSYIDDQKKAVERDRLEALRNVKEESLEYLIIWEEYEQKRVELDQEASELIADQTKKMQEKIKRYLSEFTDMGDFGFSSLNIFTEIEENGKTAFENLLDNATDWKTKIALIVTSVGEVFKDVMGAMQESSRARFENEMKQLELSYETNVLFAGESKEAKEKLEQEFEEKQRELRIKQAKRDKQMAIMNAVINTAQGVVSMLATVPWPANFVMAGLVGALGAVQIATIASTPIPEFWMGTQNAPEGLAWTQERGAEVITDKHGNVKTMGNNKGPQLTYLESGDKVFRSRQEYFDSDLASMLTSNGIGHNIKINQFDYDKFDHLLGKNRSQTNVTMQIDEDGFNYRTNKRNTHQQKVSYNARG